MDALDGICARITGLCAYSLPLSYALNCVSADEAGIQFQILNRSKGAAVWVRVATIVCSMSTDVSPQSPRAQVDRKLYKKHIQSMLHNYPNLELRAGSVFDLVLNKPSASTDFLHSEVRGVQLGELIVLSSFVPSDIAL